MGIELSGTLAGNAGTLPSGMVSNQDARLTDAQRALLSGRRQATGGQEGEGEGEARPEGEGGGGPREQVPPPVPGKVLCPRCGWDHAVPAGGEPTESDREAFRKAVLTDARFYKEYRLMDGALHVTFRSLTADEQDACSDRASRELNEGKFKTDAAYYRAVADYNYALGVARLSRQGLVYTAKEGVDAAGALGEAVTEVFGQVATSALTRNVGRTAYRDFSLLVHTLEARAAHPNS